MFECVQINHARERIVPQDALSYRVGSVVETDRNQEVLGGGRVHGHLKRPSQGLIDSRCILYVRRACKRL